MNCRLFAILALAALAVPPASAQPSAPKKEKQSVEDVIPLTIGNLRGHKTLYNEGWYVVTSSSRALEYAKQQSIVSSKEAIRVAWGDASSETGDLGRNVKADVRNSIEEGDAMISSTVATGVKIVAVSRGVAREEFAYAKDGFKKAAEPFVRGHVSLVRRTEEDRRELAATPGNYFKNLKNDFSNVDECAAAARRQFAKKIGPAWEKAFQQASREFKAEYDRSGDEKNSLAALGPILRGYLEAFYHGFAAPAAKTIALSTVVGASEAVFLPASAAMIVSGRTVQSVGLTVYYAGKSGVHVLAPTVESGFLSAVSLLSLGAAPITYAGGDVLGAVNRVAFTAASPVAASIEAAATVSYHSAAYVGLLAYDAATGVSTVAINQGESGMVLGYNALTAIPAHAFMGGGDAVVFLAWDGPRLLIAAARGRLRSDRDGESYSLGELPSGTVVDLKELRQAEGVKIEALSTDPAVIKQVLEKIPADARGADANR